MTLKVKFSSTRFLFDVNKSTKWSKSVFMRDPRIKGPSLHIFCTICFLVLDWETSIDPFVMAINDLMSFQKESSKKQSCFLEWPLIWFFSLLLYVFPLFVYKTISIVQTMVKQYTQKCHLKSLESVHPQQNHCLVYS